MYMFMTVVALARVAALERAALGAEVSTVPTGR
jgi:hypothetical protein